MNPGIDSPTHLGRWVHIPNLCPPVTLMTCIGVVTKLAVCEAPQRRGAGAEKAPIIQAFSGTGHRSCICSTTRGTVAVRLLDEGRSCRVLWWDCSTHKTTGSQPPGHAISRHGVCGLTSDIPGVQDAMAMSNSTDDGSQDPTLTEAPVMGLANCVH